MESYSVKRGDNLWKIVTEKYKLKDSEKIAELVKDIAEKNNIDEPDSIFIGQKILLDVKKEPPAALQQPADRPLLKVTPPNFDLLIDKSKFHFAKTDAIPAAALPQREYVPVPDNVHGPNPGFDSYEPGFAEVKKEIEAKKEGTKRFSLSNPSFFAKHLSKYQEAAKRIQEAIEENEKELKLSDNGNNVDINAVRKILDEFELPTYEGKADKAKNGDVIVSSPQPVTEEAPKVKIRNVNGTEISSPVKRKGTESAKTLSKPRKTKYHDIDITHKYTGTAEQINKYLGGVLKGKGAKFIELQEKYGINAAFLAAIAINESSNGTSYGARKRNNVGGVREYGSYKFKVYERVEDCLEDMADFLSDNYVGEGRTTIGTVGAKYCPVDDKSDKENINQFWPRNVGYHMSRIDPSVRYQV